MNRENLEQITGMSEAERDAQVVAKLEQSNPSVADFIKKNHPGLREEGKTPELVITEQMRRDAAAHDLNMRKQLGDDF